MRKNALSSRLRFIKKMLEKNPDITITDKTIIKSSDILPTIPYTYIEFDIPNSKGKGGKPGDTDELNVLDIDEFLEIYDAYISLPIKEKKYVEEKIIKYGKDKVGRESQIDIEKTLLNRIKTLVLQGEEIDENLIDKIFSFPFYDDDIIYNIFSKKIEYHFIPFVTYNIDISSSVSDEERLIYKSILFLLMNYLRKNFDVSYLQLLLHSVNVYDFSIHKIERDVDLKEFIKSRKSIEEYFKKTEGGGTSYAEWIKFYVKYLGRKLNTTKYLFYGSDFLVNNEDILMFKKEVLLNPNLSYAVILISVSPSYNKSIKDSVDKIIDILIPGVPQDKYSIIIFSITDGKYTLFDLIKEISINIGKEGVHYLI